MSPAASPNFGSILDKAPGEVNRPPAFPQGTYLAVIKGLPREDKSAKKQTEFVEFALQPLQAQDDVDTDALKEFGGLADHEMKLTFYLTDKSLYRLKEFMIDDLGIEEGDSLRAMIDETPGKQCMVHIKHTPSDDGKGVYANISSTAPVEG